MCIMEVIKQRRSIRDYEDRPVPEEKLNRILEAARLSPSARNSQDRKFIVIREKEQRRKLAQSAGHQPHVAKAPVLIAAVGTKPEYHMPNGVPAYPVDLAIALDHMTLVAVEEGLGTCWIGGFSQEIAQALNAKGYRTAGNQGNRPFSRDTVRGMLQNCFYIGQLINGDGGWTKAKHEPFISKDL